MANRVMRHPLGYNCNLCTGNLYTSKLLKTTKKNYSNSIRVGSDRVEQNREGVSGGRVRGELLGRGTATVHRVAA